MTSLGEIRTPALVVDLADFEHNLRVMSDALPGPRLRPHVKAHKCTALARRQSEAGHLGFTCATILEVERMAAARDDPVVKIPDELIMVGRVLMVQTGLVARINPSWRMEDLVAARLGP